MSINWLNNVMTATVADDVLTWSHSDTTVPSNNNATIQFRARFMGGATNDNPNAGQLRVHWRCGTQQRMVVVTPRGVGLPDGASATYPTPADHRIGVYHNYMLQYTGETDTVAVYINDVYTHTLDLNGIDPGETTRSIMLEFVPGQEDPPVPWAMQLGNISYWDSLDDELDVYDRIVNVFQYSQPLSGGAVRTFLLAATESTLYVDSQEQRVWVVLSRLQNGQTNFLPFQNKLLIFDSGKDLSARVLVWTGTGSPTRLSNAPPMRFGTEHRTRVFGAGDRRYPLRVYFSGSRQEDLWFAPAHQTGPASYDAVTQAGYINIPSVSGDEVVGLYGEYYGNVIVVTKTSIWRIVGSSPQSYQLENITRQVGGGTHNGIVHVGNDLFILGGQGVVSLQSSQTVGGVQTQMVTGAISDLWSGVVQSAKYVDKAKLPNAHMTVLPALGLVCLGMQSSKSEHLDLFYVYSLITQSWYGPWVFAPGLEVTCFATVAVGVPAVDTLALGTATGQIMLLHFGRTTDDGAPYITKYGSAMLNGRSLAPALVSADKTWRLLRLYIIPKNNSAINVRWRTDQATYNTVTLYQQDKLVPVLDDLFTLDVDVLAGAQEIEVLTVPLDVKGRYLHFDLQCEREFVLQGYEVEFLAEGVVPQ